MAPSAWSELDGGLWKAVAGLLSQPDLLMRFSAVSKELRRVAFDGVAELPVPMPAGVWRDPRDEGRPLPDAAFRRLCDLAPNAAKVTLATASRDLNRLPRLRHLRCSDVSRGLPATVETLELLDPPRDGLPPAVARRACGHLRALRLKCGLERAAELLGSFGPDIPDLCLDLTGDWDFWGSPAAEWTSRLPARGSAAARALVSLSIESADPPPAAALAAAYPRLRSLALRGIDSGLAASYAPPGPSPGAPVPEVRELAMFDNAATPPGGHLMPEFAHLASLSNPSPGFLAHPRHHRLLPGLTSLAVDTLSDRVPLGALKGLTSLRVENAWATFRRVDPVGLAAALPNLTSLVLERIGDCEDLNRALSRLRHQLRLLDLHGCKTAITCLAFPNLAVLHLKDCELIRADLLEDLASLRRLRMTRVFLGLPGVSPRWVRGVASVEMAGCTAAVHSLV